MWTPRSVAIQNKDFMVHIKYGSHKFTLQLPHKDSTTVDQLKHSISQELNIAESDVNILINGKPLPVQQGGHVTVSQARIPNNCKILVTNKGLSEVLQFATTSSDYGAHASSTAAARVPSAAASDNGAHASAAAARFAAAAARDNGGHTSSTAAARVPSAANDTFDTNYRAHTSTAAKAARDIFGNYYRAHASSNAAAARFAAAAASDNGGHTSYTAAARIPSAAASDTNDTNYGTHTSSTAAARAAKDTFDNYYRAHAASNAAARVFSAAAARETNESNTIDTQLDSIKAKSVEISQTVRSLEDMNSQLKRSNSRQSRCVVSVQEIKGHKKTAGVQGELLMRCLENLDRQQIDPGMHEQKSRRKELATLLNNILDRNDRVMADLSQHIKSIES